MNYSQFATGNNSANNLYFSEDKEDKINIYDL